MTPLFEPVVAEHDPLLPDPYRLVGKRLETDDIVTLFLEPVDGARQELRAGQFNMLTAFGVGEVAISVSGAPGAAGPLEHTVRAVGAVRRRALPFGDRRPSGRAAGRSGRTGASRS